jgi:phosphatidylethanolamine-binding protein (PEBP) family uncharacterized protein
LGYGNLRDAIARLVVRSTFAGCGIAIARFILSAKKLGCSRFRACFPDSPGGADRRGAHPVPFSGAKYDGPSPPNNLTAVSHNCVVTVSALDTKLPLTSLPSDFPANAETLYRAMFDHVIDSGSIHGLFSSAD